MAECITDEELAAWASGAVAPERLTSVRVHIASCASCRTVAAEVSRTAGARPKPVTLGRYEIREPVGAGGMGTVYAAWDPMLARTVAVKLLHEAAHDSHRGARFLLERQVLASLEHPHIARLLDAGETDDGRPWFAMDFIDGQPLDVACDAAKLTPTQRVELLLPVLRAVTAAHQHLVVHRDLKPSNVLVDAKGEPHLVDFGIARLLEGASGLTQTGMTPMTPAYASPEQVRREPAAVTSDVYSLGVVLYELLSGVSPYETKPGDVEGVLVAVTSLEPRPPSQAVARAPDAAVSARGLSREKLRAALEGDLDAIVMMALRKEPRDRYASVQALTDDLVAALDGRPTLARRGDRAYRAALFVRRNRALVAGVSAAFAALVVGLVATVWQARRAEAERDLAQQRFSQVRALAKAVLFDYHDGIADLPGSTALRERLVKDAQGYLEALAAQAGDDVALKQELANSYLKLGDVQGDPYGPSLGDTTSAKASYLKGRALAESVLAQVPKDRASRRTLARSSEKLGAIEEVTGDVEVAVTGYLEAARLDGELLAEAPGDLDQQYALSRDEIAVGQTLAQLGRLEEGRRHLTRALELRRPVADARRDMESRSGVGAVLISLARGDIELARFAEARAAMEEADRVFSSLVSEFPDYVRAHRGLQIAQSVLSEVARHEDNSAAAVDHALKGLADARGLVAQEPDNAVFLRDLSAALAAVSIAYSVADRFDDARRAVDEAIAVTRKLHEADPENAQTIRDLITLVEHSMSPLVEQGDLTTAEARTREVETLRRALIERGADTVAAAEAATMSHGALVALLLQRRQFSRARAENQLVIEGLRAMLRDAPGNERITGRLTVAYLAGAEVAVRQAEATGRRADWELAREACRATSEAYAADVALHHAKTAGAVLLRDVFPEWVARVDDALAGRPRPPLPPENFVR